MAIVSKDLSMFRDKVSKSIIHFNMNNKLTKSKNNKSNLMIVYNKTLEEEKTSSQKKSQF